MASSHRSSAVRPRSSSARSKWRPDGVGVGLLDRQPLPTDVHETLRIAHHERTKRKPELVAVGQGQAVRTRDAHGPRLGVEPGREGAQGVHPAAHPVLGLEHDDVVALALQLVRRHQPGQTGADDQHALGRLVVGLESLIGHPAHGGGDRRGRAGRWLGRSVGKVLRQVGGHGRPS